jgi:hypothetical protein
MKRKKTRRRRPLVTINLGEEGIALLDTLVAWMQQMSPSSKRITRSFAMREAVQALYDRITDENRVRPKVTPT